MKKWEWLININIKYYFNDTKGFRTWYLMSIADYEYEHRLRHTCSDLKICILFKRLILKIFNVECWNYDHHFVQVNLSGIWSYVSPVIPCFTCPQLIWSLILQLLFQTLFSICKWNHETLEINIFQFRGHRKTFNGKSWCVTIF